VYFVEQLHTPSVLNHFLLVTGVMAAWLAISFVVGCRDIFWDYDAFKEPD
jgi:hypothetical protein